MKHTDKCVANRERYEKIRAEYVAQWPDYCKTCNGWGQFTYSFDPSPAGVSLSPGTLEDGEPCPECTERGICARCDKEGLGPEGEGPCIYCGWDYANGLPAEPECWCHAEEVWLIP